MCVIPNLISEGRIPTLFDLGEGVGWHNLIGMGREGRVNKISGLPIEYNFYWKSPKHIMMKVFYFYLFHMKQ